MQALWNGTRIAFLYVVNTKMFSKFPQLSSLGKYRNWSLLTTGSEHPARAVRFTLHVLLWLALEH